MFNTFHAHNIHPHEDSRTAFERAWKQAEAQGGGWLGTACQQRRGAGEGYSVIRAALISSLLSQSLSSSTHRHAKPLVPPNYLLIVKFCCREALADILLWKFVVNQHLIKKLLVAGENFVNEFENCGHILRLLRNAVKFGLAMILKVRSEFNIQKFPGMRLWQIKPKVGKIIHKTDKLAAD